MSNLCQCQDTDPALCYEMNKGKPGRLGWCVCKCHRGVVPSREWPASEQTQTLGRLYPFGYNEPDAKARLQGLMSNPKALLIDIRFSPHSSKWRWEENALYRRYSIRYTHHIDLGDINYRSPGKPIVLNNPGSFRGIPQLISWLQSGFDLVLLCACAEYQHCHRRTVCELVKASLPEVEIVLLQKVVPNLAMYWSDLKLSEQEAVSKLAKGK